MKKYFIYNGISVLFDGTAASYRRFMDDNGHLKGCDCSKEEFGAAKKDDALAAARNRRARKFRPVGDQLDVYFKQFKAWKEAGMSMLPEMSKLIAECQKVKDDNPLN